MKMIEVKAFDVSELKGKAREKALQWLAERETTSDFHCNDWSSYVLEDRKTDLEKLGYSDIGFSWSGFGSQGDGLSFTARVDLTSWLVADKKRLSKYRSLLNDIRLEHIEASINRINDRYCHSNTVSAQVSGDCDALDKHATKMKELEGDIDADARKRMDGLYKELWTVYCDITSEENLIDIAMNNDLMFDEYGESLERYTD